MKEISEFSTVEEFWRFWAYMPRPRYVSKILYDYLISVFFLVKFYMMGIFEKIIKYLETLMLLVCLRKEFDQNGKTAIIRMQVS